MKILMIKDLTSFTKELDREVMAAVHGGMMKRPLQAPIGSLLTSPDGEPVSVYVDGVLINSVTDGYVHH